MSGNGDALVLWTEDRAERTRMARLAMAAAGGRPQTIELGELPRASQPALAVAPDGRALAALPGREALTVVERSPGGAFGASAAVAALPDRIGTRVSAALGPGGEAVVTWSGFALGGVGAVSDSFSSADEQHFANRPRQTADAAVGKVMLLDDLESLRPRSAQARLVARGAGVSRSSSSRARSRSSVRTRASHDVR